MVDKSDRLYDAIGRKHLFETSQLIGEGIGLRLFGQSKQDDSVLFPMSWKLSSLGKKQKMDLVFTPVSHNFKNNG